MVPIVRAMFLIGMICVLCASANVAQAGGRFFSRSVVVNRGGGFVPRQFVEVRTVRSFQAVRSFNVPSCHGGSAVFFFGH